MTIVRPTPEQWASVQAQLVTLANTAYPKEACGFIFATAPPGVLDSPATHELYATAVTNVAEWPYAQFRISPDVVELAYRSGNCIATWHSHPEDPAVPSPLDVELAPEALYFVIYAVADEDMAVFVKVNGQLEPQVFVMPS